MSLKGQEFINKQQMLVAIREVNPTHEMGQVPVRGSITDAYRHWISEHPALADSISVQNFGSLAVYYGICTRGRIHYPKANGTLTLSTSASTPKLGLISRIEELERIVLEQQEFIERLKEDLYND